jgi:hypothetical protein
VGEDFVLLSSAKFDSGKIEVAKRVGLDLILPLAAVLPFERHVRWAQTMKIPRKVALELMGAVEELAAALGVAGRLIAKLIGRNNKALDAVALLLSRFGPDAIRLVKDKLRETDADALAKEGNLTATLTGFLDDLKTGEKEQILLTSPR